MAQLTVETATLNDVLERIRFDKRIDAYYASTPVLIPPSKIRVFRPSGLSRLCPVLAAYLIRLLKAKKIDKKRLHEFVQENQLPTHLTQIVDTGTVVHRQLQFYAGLVGLAMRGQWRCPACGFYTHKAVPMPTTKRKDPKGETNTFPRACPKCRNNLGIFPPWLYVEPNLVENAKSIEPQLRVSGSIDQLWDVQIAPGVFVPILPDFKTINKAGWKEDYGKLPKDDHVAQMQYYLALANQDRLFLKLYGPVRFGVLVYYCKDDSKHKYKGVEYDPAVWADKMNEVKWARVAAAYPKTLRNEKSQFRFCNSVKDKQARSCLFSKDCWDGQAAPVNWLA